MGQHTSQRHREEDALTLVGELRYLPVRVTGVLFHLPVTHQPVKGYSPVLFTQQAGRRYILGFAHGYHLESSLRSLGYRLPAGLQQVLPVQSAGAPVWDLQQFGLRVNALRTSTPQPAWFFRSLGWLRCLLRPIVRRVQPLPRATALPKEREENSGLPLWWEAFCGAVVAGRYPSATITELQREATREALHQLVNRLYLIVDQEELELV